MGARGRYVATDELQRAYNVLGLQPGVSPLRARRRYLALVKQWHPDRHEKDPASQAAATARTQQITEAYRRIKLAASHGDVPLRRPRAWEPSADGKSSTPIVDTSADRFVRFAVGVLLGFLLNFAILSESWVVWLLLPLLVGATLAMFGWGILEWALRNLWWLV